MTKHPEKDLKPSDIPEPVHGAARYKAERCQTGGFNVIMISTEGRDVIDHKSSEQAALRVAIRFQKRENAAVAASRNAGGR
jgi:hypothetical protein